MPRDDPRAPTAGDRETVCREVVELVTAYLEDALPPEQRAGFEAHLETCPACVTYVDQIRATIAAAGLLREQEPDPEVCDELLAAFRARRPGGAP